MSARLGIARSPRSVVAALAVLGLVAFGLWASQPVLASGGSLCSGDFDVVLPMRHIVIDPNARQVDLDLTLCNDTGSALDIDIAIDGAPEAWNVFVKPEIGTLAIMSISMSAGSTRELLLRMANFESRAPGAHRMTLSFTSLQGDVAKRVNVSAEFPPGADEEPAEEARRITLTPDYSVVEGPAEQTFLFEVLVRNFTGDKNSFGLSSEAPPGWTVVFADIFDRSRLVSSVSLENLRFRKVRIKADAPRNAEAGSYPIVVRASIEDVTGQVVLRADVTGSFGVMVSTPDDRLNIDVRAGQPSPAALKISNTGNAELRDLALLADPPADWKVDFDIETIEGLEAGASVDVPFTITSSGDAIPGDYTIIFRASSPEALDSAQIQVTVSQSAAWRWLGIILVIVVVVGLVGLYAKLGTLWSRA